MFEKTVAKAVSMQSWPIAPSTPASEQSNSGSWPGGDRGVDVVERFGRSMRDGDGLGVGCRRDRPVGLRRFVRGSRPCEGDDRQGCLEEIHGTSPFRGWRARPQQAVTMRDEVRPGRLRPGPGG